MLEDAEEFLTAKGVVVIDILALDTEGCERPILDRIRSRVPKIKVIYVKYHSTRVSHSATLRAAAAPSFTPSFLKSGAGVIFGQLEADRGPHASWCASSSS
jgi:hypothetical protein